MKWNKKVALGVVTGVISGTVLVHAPAVVVAESSRDLRQRIEVLEKKVREMKVRLQATERKAENAWKKASVEGSRSVKWHLGGYATVDLPATKETGESDSFAGGKFAPVFLIEYKDLISFESELGMTGTCDGETSTILEFANFNVMATDWLTLTAATFFSPLGVFQQHQHTDWINKLPDRPAGFVEEGGTEHLSEVGRRARTARPRIFHLM